jgi:hypothetical protein
MFQLVFVFFLGKFFCKFGGKKEVTKDKKGCFWGKKMGPIHHIINLKIL